MLTATLLLMTIPVLIAAFLVAFLNLWMRKMYNDEKPDLDKATLEDELFSYYNPDEDHFKMWEREMMR